MAAGEKFELPSNAAKPENADALEALHRDAQPGIPNLKTAELGKAQRIAVICPGEAPMVAAVVKTEAERLRLYRKICLGITEADE